MFIDDLRKKLRAISARDAAVVVGWAVTLTLLVIIVEYVKPMPLRATSTRFDSLELAIILVTSLIVGAVLLDPVKILYGFIAATTLSVVMSVIFSSLYDLYVLGLGEYFSALTPGWEWEWVAWLAFLRIFKMAFPAALILIFAGGMVGGIAGAFLWPHRD
ncbi:MAG: hypothetical protein NWF14_01485 [Candidatus Bathyarchaeota archaeon]|nr:hypothetical protein [Candidatus Bathyarchaeota archaeon]